MYIVEIIVSMLLIIAIIYGIKLGKKIDKFNQGKQEFVQIIKYFDNSVKVASSNLEKVKQLSENIDKSMNEKIDEANIVLDNLRYTLEKANEIADEFNNNLNTKPVPVVKKPRYRISGQVDKISEDIVIERQTVDSGQLANKSRGAVRNEKKDRSTILASIMDNIASVKKHGSNDQISDSEKNEIEQDIKRALRAVREEENV